MKRSILFLFEYPSLNGGEYSCLSVLPALGQRFQIMAAAPDMGPLNEQLIQRGVKTFPFNIFNEDGKRHSRQEIFSQLENIVAQANPDQIHANSLSMSRMLGAWRSETKFAGKVTGHLRDMLKLSQAAIGDLNRLDKLAAVSRAVRDYHIQQNLQGDKVEVIYNGVDLDLFHPAPATHELHAELGVPTHWSIVGAVGQIGLRKGVSYFVEAAKQASELHCDCAFVYVGERHSQKAEAIEYEAELKKAASQDSLAGRFFFLGRRTDVPKLINEFTVVVHAALQEPLGRVLLEAAAAHKPIIATDVGGTREIFASPNQALIVPPKDAAAIARAIISLLENESRCKQRSRAAGDVARTRFSIAMAAQSLTAFFTK